MAKKETEKKRKKLLVKSTQNLSPIRDVKDGVIIRLNADDGWEE